MKTVEGHTQKLPPYQAPPTHTVIKVGRRLGTRLGQLLV